ncbi:DUF4215 domain-containing protein [Nannocystis pusilla]|uniref:DUF4215 domain-containing protein n=1 Tax=Nannocystis pusilla TaxID=889268 RepID=UPI003B7A2AE8
MSFPARTSALTVFVLAGCIPSIVIGDAPQATDSDSGEPGSSSADTNDAITALPTTTDAIAVCGDGQLGPGEVCDDGNDEPNDGCDEACGRSGRLEWTLEPGNADFVTDLAVGSQGQIVISGVSGQQGVLLALSPGGVEQWRLPAAVGKLAVHADGRIFLGALGGSLRSFSSAGAELWSTEPLLPTAFAIALAGDVLYAGADGQFDDAPGQRILVSKHRQSDGAELWRQASELHSVGEDLVVVDGSAIVIGHGRTPGVDDSQSFLGVIDEDGVWIKAELAGQPAHANATAAAPGAGGLLLANFGADPDVLLQRRGPDLAALWSVPGSDAFASVHLAAGPDERIALAGMDPSDHHRSAVHLHDGSGALRWSSVFVLPNPELSDLPAAAAFGPDFLVVAGSVFDEQDTTHARMWVRRLALD